MNTIALPRPQRETYAPADEALIEMAAAIVIGLSALAKNDVLYALGAIGLRQQVASDIRAIADVLDPAGVCK